LESFFGPFSIILLLSKGVISCGLYQGKIFSAKAQRSLSIHSSIDFSSIFSQKYSVPSLFKSAIFTSKSFGFMPI